MMELSMQNGPGTQTYDNFGYAETYPSTLTIEYQNEWWNLACKTVRVHKRKNNFKFCTAKRLFTSVNIKL